MPEKVTMERAKEDLREGKSPSTAAGEFVHEEIEHVREGKHGARSPQQAIAIGLSKARRAGIPLKPPARGKATQTTRARAKKDYEKGRTDPKTEPEGNSTRSRSRLKTMQRSRRAPHRTRPCRNTRSARRGAGKVRVERGHKGIVSTPEERKIAVRDSRDH
jgi:hypothetical protein